VRRRGRRDENHAELVRVLEQLGASVVDLADVGGGVPDLLVGYLGRTVLVEIKNPATRYGRDGLSASQREFRAGWRGGRNIVAVSSIAECVDLVTRRDR